MCENHSMAVVYQRFYAVEVEREKCASHFEHHRTLLHVLTAEVEVPAQTKRVLFVEERSAMLAPNVVVICTRLHHGLRHLQTSDNLQTEMHG
jgi:hypothetical protein